MYTFDIIEFLFHILKTLLLSKQPLKKTSFDIKGTFQLERDIKNYIFLNKRLFLRSFLVFLVGVPFVNLPQGVTCATGGDPLPSPPPCGWSHGFLITPLTIGLKPKALFFPALPTEIELCNGLDTIPKEAID